MEIAAVETISALKCTFPPILPRPSEEKKVIFTFGLFTGGVSSVLGLRFVPLQVSVPNTRLAYTLISEF